MRFSLHHELQLPRPWSDGAQERLFEEALAQAALADRLGFHGVWVPEHHFLEELSHAAAPEVFLAAASQRTRRLRLGIAGQLVAPGFAPPARVAAQAATLDVLSGGRVRLGVGEAATAAELDGFGVDRATQRAQAQEAVGVLARLLAEEPFTGHDGRFLTLPPRQLVPRPVQRPHPPLWMACARRDDVRVAASLGLGALGVAFVEPEEAGGWVEDFDATLASDGCVPAGASVAAQVAVALPMHVHADEAQALERGIDGAQFLAYARGHFGTFGEHRPGRTSLWESFLARRDDTGYARSVLAVDGAPLSVRVLRGGRGALRGAIGTPDQVRELVGRYAAAGVDELVLHVQTGAIAHEHVCAALELFAAEVLPAFAVRADDEEDARRDRRAPAVARALARRPPPPEPDPAYRFGARSSAAEAAPGPRSSAADAAPAPRPSPAHAPSAPVDPATPSGSSLLPVPLRSDPDTSDVAALLARIDPAPVLDALRRAAARVGGFFETRVERLFARHVSGAEDSRLERLAGSRPGLRILFSAMASRFDPERAEGFTGELQFDLRPTEGELRTWTITVGPAAAIAKPGPAGDPALVLQLSVGDFLRIAAGELDPGTALLSGRLDLTGDFAVALRLGAMFGR